MAKTKNHEFNLTNIHPKLSRYPNDSSTYISYKRKLINNKSENFKLGCSWGGERSQGLTNQLPAATNLNKYGSPPHPYPMSTVA